MGEYLSKFIKIQDEVYENKLLEAAMDLKVLLNQINAEYITIRDPKEKEKRKKAIEKLLPAFKDLKKENLSEVVISGLMLDPSNFVHEEEKAPEVIIPVVEETPEEVQEEAVQETPEVEEAPEVQEEAPKQEETKAEAPKKNQRKRPRKELTPLTLDDYIGQTKAKESLKISIEAAKKENRVLNHLLICSSYGLGKTTLANIIANEMGLPFFSVNATNLKDTKSLSLYFSKIKESCIIFIDEIHSLKSDVQTVLLSILTDFQVSFITSDGEEEFYELPPFTLIGATTQAGELLKPFINRFQILELVDYTDQEKQVIVYSKFQKLGYDITPDAVKEVARRSRGIPRTIETFAKGIRDIALTKNTKLVDEEIVKQYFEMYEIDENGLSKNDLLILNILAKANKAMALITMESKTGIQREDLEYRYEPYLIKLGLIEKTEKGRVITPDGLKYISGDSKEEEKPTEESSENNEE